MKAWRIILAAAGISLGLFGIYRLFTQVPTSSLVALEVWLLAALLIHDGLLSPAVVGLGSLLRRFFPHRGRRYLQAALLMGALVTVVALPMIYLRGKPTARQGSPATELRAQPDPDPRPDRCNHLVALRRTGSPK